MTRAVLLLAAFWSALPSWAADGMEAGTLHDEESRLSSALQQRAQGALDAVFGAGRASVQVRVDIGLTTDANDWLARTLRPLEKEKDADRNGFSWAWLGTVAPEEKKFVLPGFPEEKKRANAAPAAAGMPGPAPVPAAEKPAAEPVDPGLVRSFGTEVLRLDARVSVDAELPPEASVKAGELVRQSVGALDSRGDTVTVERVSMPRPSELLMRRPDLVAGLAAKLILTLLGAALALGLVFFGRSLERAFRGAAERIAAAIQRTTDRTLALNIGGKANLEGAGAPGALGGAAGALSALTSAPQEEGEEDADEPPIFDIEPDEAAKLAHLLKDQPPEHVALVIPFLAPETRDAFLALLGPARAAQILGATVPVRYVDPELLKTLQDELERRLEGVMGGVKPAAELLKAFPSRRRAELLKLLREQNAEAAAALREQVLLLEDLESMTIKDLAVLASTISVEDLAAACAGMSEGFVKALSESMPRRTAAIFQEMVSLPQDADKKLAAREALMVKAEALLAEGRIKRPSSSSVRLQAEIKP
ncbi:MAG: hypothetical protein HYZ75_02350 [Elusimicrobia bacterium]|nr:hypothetical protein [Elusimicrobiota bacterium]